MQEIVDRYSSSSASTAQGLPYKDNHLYAMISPFAHGMVLRSSCTIRHTTASEIPISCATASVLGQKIASNLLKIRSSISGVRAFLERPSLQFEMTNESVFHSRRSTLEKV